MKRNTIILSVLAAVISGVGSAYYFSRHFSEATFATPNSVGNAQLVSFNPMQAPSDFTYAAENTVHGLAALFQFPSLEVHLF